MTCSRRIKEAGSFKTRLLVVSLHLASDSILGLKWSAALPKPIDIYRATASCRECGSDVQAPDDDIPSQATV